MRGNRRRRPSSRRCGTTSAPSSSQGRKERRSCRQSRRSRSRPRQDRPAQGRPREWPRPATANAIRREAAPASALSAGRPMRPPQRAAAARCVRRAVSDRTRSRCRACRRRSERGLPCRVAPSCRAAATLRDYILYKADIVPYIQRVTRDCRYEPHRPPLSGRRQGPRIS